MSERIADEQELFSIANQTAVITGGTGVLGGSMARFLARRGVRVALLSRRAGPTSEVVRAIRHEGGEALGISCDVGDRRAIEQAAREIEATFGRATILINAAGGNREAASTTSQLPFFDLTPAALHEVLTLNLIGTFYCCQVFGRGMVAEGRGSIVNIASMAALRPLTRVPAYGAAKAGVVNLTHWLAVYMAQEYSPAIRVNAIAPGFFLTEQNQRLLVDPSTGSLTERGRRILDHTPMQRLGQPEDLFGTLLWLLSPASAFVTGIVVPVDGGFSAYAGV
ncbi:MAG: SDR family oxidoreductase [Thermogemmatispora sp.]|uniref:SDR family oxidoreductase n=1 Tax=Thermogemmatispora sp. TaxID=1968838 RepID=UPI001A0D45FD|nr:SDR family oxidoreductase [Thermogemmatispora sp.]MBE3567051.1 SDR family oxidoreductase [Thermogemmatispora sp.]